MKSDTTSSSPDVAVRHLLDRAADYAAASVKAVVAELPESEQEPRKVFYDCARLIDALEVHFLFPNLTSADRRLLTSLLQARRSLLIHHRRPPKAARAADVPASVFSVGQVRKRLRGLQSQIRQSRIDVRLTPAQGKILQEQFLADPPPGH